MLGKDNDDVQTIPLEGVFFVRKSRKENVFFWPEGV